MSSTRNIRKRAVGTKQVNVTCSVSFSSKQYMTRVTILCGQHLWIKTTRVKHPYLSTLKFYNKLDKIGIS